ncbi:MAG: hypothetical protein V8S87_04290 [Oscillospiraceae bacterium]
MERKDAIRSAYRMTGSNSFYDGMITCSTPGGKAVCRLVWDMDKAECDDYLEKAPSGIPEGFSGKLLEVPVGTGAVCAPELADADLLRGHVPAHFGSAYAVLTGKTVLPRRMLIFHQLVWQLVFVLIPDIRQLLGAEVSTWDFVLSQGSGNAALCIWMAANAVWAGRQLKTEEVK